MTKLPAQAPPDPPVVPGTAALLELRDFGVSSGARPILEGITLRLERAGGVTVLLGPKASGKSSLLRAIAGRGLGCFQVSGTRLHRGHDPGHTLEAALAMHRPGDLSLPLGHVLASAARRHPEARALSRPQLTAWIEQQLDTLELASMRAYLDTPLVSLPRASLRVAGLLRSAFTGSELLLFDGPTRDLSEADGERVLQLVAQLGRSHACLVVLDRPAQARHVADRIVLLDQGRLALDVAAPHFFSGTGLHPLQARFLAQDGFAPKREPEPPLHAGNAAPGTVAGAPSAVSPAVSAAPHVAVAAVQSVPTPAPPAAPAAADEPPMPDPADCDLARPGPYGFHWLVPGRLAGCQMPGVVAPLDYDLDLLRSVGITRLVNLTDRRLPAEALKRHGLTDFQLPVEDRKAPPIMWTKLLLARMDAFMRAGDVIAVHCLAGLGRTGVVLGCWLVREGLNAEAALQRLRAIDPRYVQSAEQEALLQELETNLLVRLGSGLDQIAGHG